MTTIATRGLADYRRNIAAGETATIYATGRFIVCRTATHALELVIDGQRVAIAAGDWLEIERFERLEITNPNPTTAADVTLTIGFGRFGKL